MRKDQLDAQEAATMDERTMNARAPDDRAPDERTSNDRTSGDRAPDDRTPDDRTPDDRAWIIERVGRPLFDQLATGLRGSELNSVLLEVMRQRAARRKLKEVLAQHRSDLVCRRATVDLRTSMAIDGALLAAAQDFEAIELSPVAPLGTCSTMALTHQNRVLSALRTTEVASDPTNVLALECALRLEGRLSGSVHLATSQRVVRTQPAPRGSGYSQHFRLFVLASGGRETKDHAFTIEAVTLHVRTMLVALEGLESLGYSFGARRVEVLATPDRAAIADRVADGLGAMATRNTLDHAYYSGGLRYQIWATSSDGSPMPLVDGGTFDWLAKMTSNRRLVYVASGIGAQLIALRFRTAEGRSPVG